MGCVAVEKGNTQKKEGESYEGYRRCHGVPGYASGAVMRYYGVVGNRDYIKMNGEKRPFWEFLDRQPDGYLTSLAYKRKDLPDSHMIFDCGAWSYRKDDVPKITAETALGDYLTVAREGDFLIAPDHMLIPDVDHDLRREFNRKQARTFLEICPVDFVPMATGHGMDIEERVEHTKYLRDLGYTHIAIGGIAARASQKKLVLGMVQALRDEVSDVWLHVLGLSSPSYAAAWHEIGVQSFDGSSHFKQAFTAGTFFVLEDGRLKKWQAARPTRGEVATAPECNCTACSKLRGQGVDTRTYGSNENNMGRAAHNMNQLMIAQRYAVDGDTVLVSCVGKKRTTAQPAKDLYISDWFIKAREYAENNGKRWYILSAKHGLLHPDTVIDPYEKTLNTMGAEERRAWAEQVDTAIAMLPGRLVCFAGEKYREHLQTPLETPLKGRGIGEQLRWFNLMNQGQPKQQRLFDVV